MVLTDARDDSSLARALRGLGNNQSLAEFLANVGTLTHGQRLVIIRQASLLLGAAYAHLPLKRARHAIDPVQQLEVLRREQELLSESGFHAAMLQIFKGLRDAHTNYGLPKPYRGKVAFLPFLMEAYYNDERQRRFLVTRTLAHFSHPTFQAGVDVTHWNGTPIERAVQLHADREEGSNAAARFAFGLASMTVRSLGAVLPPDEQWVIVGYETSAGHRYEILFPWRVWNKDEDPAPDLSGMEDEGFETTEAGIVTSLNARMHELHLSRKRLFAPEAMAAEARVADSMAVGAPRRSSNGAPKAPPTKIDLRVESKLPNVFQFARHTIQGREFGYMRLRTFGHKSVQAFVAEFIRILGLMPDNGLVVDVRGNGGGIVTNGEMCLQLLTSRRISPAPFQFISNDFTATICSQAPSKASQEVKLWRSDLSKRWGDSIRQSNTTGSPFSNGIPLTDPDAANSIGQRYFGPVALITDAQCYSTTDLFAAGFQDHEIGKILGVDGNTGAGGANVWTHNSHLVPLLAHDNVGIEKLPGGTTMRVSIRRSLRVGPRFGQPLEDLGVVPDEMHYLTRRDLLEGNVDMIQHAIELIADQPVRLLNANANAIEGMLDKTRIRLTTKGLHRIDVFFDRRPMHSMDLDRDGYHGATIPHPIASVRTIEVRGYDQDQLVARRLIHPKAKR